MPPHLYDLRRPGRNVEAQLTAFQENGVTKEDVLRLDETNFRSRSGKKKYYMLSQSAIPVDRQNSPMPAATSVVSDGSTANKNQNQNHNPLLTPSLSKQVITVAPLPADPTDATRNGTRHQGRSNTNINNAGGDAKEFDSQMRAAALQLSARYSSLDMSDNHSIENN